MPTENRKEKPDSSGDISLNKALQSGDTEESTVFVSQRAKVIKKTEDDISSDNINIEVPSKTFSSVISNFIYHHKLSISVVLICAVLTVFTFGQLSSDKQHDTDILYAGRMELTASLIREISAAFTGAGADSFRFYGIWYMTEAEIEELEGEYQKMGKEYHGDRTLNGREYNAFIDELNTGSVVLMLVNPSLYGYLTERDALLPLAEFMDVPAEISFDQYSVRLGDTEFYKYYGAVRYLPEDTYICIRDVSLMDSIKKQDKEKALERAVGIFRSVVNFCPPADSDS